MGKKEWEIKKKTGVPLIWIILDSELVYIRPRKLQQGKVLT